MRGRGGFGSVFVSVCANLVLLPFCPRNGVRAWGSEKCVLRMSCPDCIAGLRALLHAGMTFDATVWFGRSCREAMTSNTRELVAFQSYYQLVLYADLYRCFFCTSSPYLVSKYSATNKETHAVVNTEMYLSRRYQPGGRGIGTLVLQKGLRRVAFAANVCYVAHLRNIPIELFYSQPLPSSLSYGASAKLFLTV